MAETESKPPPVHSALHQLVAEKVGKSTVDWLREQRDAGTTWRQISLRLWRDHELDVTEVTLRKWWADAHPVQP